MTKRYFVVGTFFGIQLRIDYSWFIIFALIAWTIITSYLPSYRHGLPAWALIVAGLVVTVIFFASVIAHEYAHSLVANRRGLRIKRITLFVFGGASELQHEPDDAKTELLMTVAGPLTSMVIAGLFGLIWLAAKQLHLTAVEVVSEPVAVLNFVVGLFNLLPAYPLDGGRILRSIIWLVRKDFLAATKAATNAGLVLSYMLMGLGVLEALTGYIVGGLWLLIIAYFLNQAARFSYAQVLHEKTLAGVKVSDILNDRFVTVPAGTHIDSFLTDFVLRQKLYDFLVTDKHGEVTGIIEFSRVGRLGRDLLRQPIDNYMQPLTKALILKPDDSAVKAFRIMQSHNLDILPVMTNDELRGVVIRRYLEDYLMVHRLRQDG